MLPAFSAWIDRNGAAARPAADSSGAPWRGPLRGSRNPRVASAEDVGRLADDQRIHCIQLHFKPSAAQTTALARLIADQQNAAFPRYHKWLIPEEFGSRFGLTANDVNGVKGWLEGQGFQIDV